MVWTRWPWVWAVAATLLAGCTAPAVLPPPDLEATGSSHSAVVVGFVDSGINPYHEQFRDPAAVLPPWIVDPTTGGLPVTLELTREGSYEERVQADREAWNTIEVGRLYWFAGTRILGLSLGTDEGDVLLLDASGHGTGVASTVRNLSGDAWLVMVQTPGSATRAAALFELIGEGVQWLAAQPWVDVISISRGLEGNPPMPLWEPVTRGTRDAVGAGKLVTVGAANLPAPTLASGTNGPPWVIAVGGAESSTRGEQPRSGRAVDVASDFTRRVAAPATTEEYQTLHGTSFSTPVVAGVLAAALAALRGEGNEASEASGQAGVLCACQGRGFTNADLREALNVSAAYWNATDWDPLNYSEDPVQLALYSTIPTSPAPWVQMGWGYVGDGTWRVLVDALTGAAVPPAKPEAARMHMAAQQALREAYWSR